MLGLKWKDLLLFCFDPNQARALGLNTTRAPFHSSSRCSRASAVAALQTVGACLVVAMLVTPGATAYLLTDRFGRMIGIAAAMGVGTSLRRRLRQLLFRRLDRRLHRHAANAALRPRALSSRPKHGMLAARRRRHGAAGAAA